MINKRAIKKFLARKLDNFDFVKSYKRQELLAELNSLKPVPQFGSIKPWLHQMACFLLMLELKRFMFNIDMGGGKALKFDEPVLTPKGWVPIESLKIGDLVYGSKGKPIKVLGVYPQGKKPIFKVTFSDNATVHASSDHIWAVTTPTRRWRGEKYNLKTTEELLATGLRDTNGWGRWFIPMGEPINFGPHPKLPLHPYALGVWLGDGCRLSPSISSMDEEIPIRVCSYLNKELNLVKRPSKNSKASTYKFVRPHGQGKTNEFGATLTKLGVYSKYSWERFIPNQYLWASIPDRICLLNGLIDTDGYISPNGFTYYDSSSKALAEGVTHLVRSLGGTAKLSAFKPNKHKGHWQVSITLPIHIEPCLLTRKLERLRHSRRRQYPPTRAITAIEPTGEADCVCIKVDAEDGLFVTNDFVLTHNTLLMLMLLLYRKQRGEKFKAVVFVPYITSVLTWIEQVEEHNTGLKLVPLLGSRAENLAALQGDGDLFVICYQSAVAMVTETIFNKKKNKNQWQLTAAQVRKYFAGFDTIICDEIHKCSSASSLTYRMCRAIAKEAKWRFGLTGTPFGKDPISLQPQFFLIDFGKTLSPTVELFRAIFYNEGHDVFGRYEFTFKKKLETDLHRIVKNRSIYYAIDELHGMPQKIYIKKTLPPPPDSEGYCKAALQQLNAAVKGGHYREAESSYLKLRQLSSGFMTLRGEDNDKIQIKFEENPKLEALIDLVESMPAASKMVVFHHFVYTNQLISDCLKELKIGHARIWGKARDPIGQLRKFKTDASCRVLVINDQSGSSSLNLQLANYLVFFEQPDSPINRQQAERRLWRPGQTKRVLIYDLLVRATKDHALHQSNKAGEDLMKSIIAGRTKL